MPAGINAEESYMKKIVLAAICAISFVSSALCDENSEIPNATENVSELSENEQTEAAESPNPENDFDIDFNEDVTEVYITGYIGESDKIIIPETIQDLPVTRIVSLQKDEYENRQRIWNIKKLSVPSSVREIEGISDLGNRIETGTEVVLSEGLLSIENGAFEDAKISSINFPSTLKYIKEAAFSDAEFKNEIVLNEGLMGISDRAFWQAKIPSVIFPSSLKYIGLEAFGGSKLKEVNLKEGVEYIGACAFYYSNIKTLTLPASIKYFGLVLEYDKSNFGTIKTNSTFYMDSVCDVNLPKDTSNWHIALFVEKNSGYYIFLSKDNRERDFYKPKNSYKLSDIVFSPVDSKIAADRKKEVEVHKKLENVTLQEADSTEFKTFLNGLKTAK